MKNKLLLLMVLMLTLIQTFAQNTITKSVKYADLKDHNVSQKLDVAEIALIRQSATCILRIEGIPNAIKVLKANSKDFIFNNTHDTATKKIQTEILNAYSSDTKQTIKFDITDNTSDVKLIHSVIITWSSNDDKDSSSKSNASRDAIIKQFLRESTFSQPYSSNSDRVDLYFDEFGRLLNHLPVNVDQNDLFYFHILCKEGDENRFSIQTVQGDYAPVDLAIKPSVAINVPTGSDKSKDNPIPTITYTQIKPLLVAGPFTSEYFKFSITHPTTGDTDDNGPEYSMKINKLYHVGVGVSYIGTNLASPDFRTIFNGTDTTIQSYNGGSRSMLTFNAIWYWSVLQQDHRGSIITSGRDILKDEPSWSFRRVFPTVGISLDGKFDENLFVGAVYEFARGGSIIGGMHYGKVKRLAMKDFTEGVTKFSGKDADIKTENVFKTSWFIGVNLDTRIFNTLSNKK